MALRPGGKPASVTEHVLPGQQHDPSTAGDPTAVMGRRTLAWVLDLLIYWALAVALYAFLAAPVDIPAGFGLDACESLRLQDPDAASGCLDLGDTAYVTSTADNLVQTLFGFLYFAFFVVLQGLTGGSPGKWLTGLRVVDEQGEVAGIGRSLLRTLLWVVDAAPWCIPLVGFIVGLTSTGHRRVGDLAAKTYVVRRSAVGTPPMGAVAVAPAGAWGAPPPPSWQPAAPPGQPWSGAPAPPPRMDAPPTGPPPRIPDAEDLVPEVSGTPEPGPDPATWEDPSPTADSDWAPPTTPGADFDTSADPSPTAGPSPFVAPGADQGWGGDSGAPTGTGGDGGGTAGADAPGYAPQWDQARNTYIQWDPARQQWLQWDSVANRWKLIDT